MQESQEELAEYVHLYTIALLPNISEGDFERHFLEEVLPNFEVTHRPVGALRLNHSLMKSESEERADRYVWEIRVRFTQRVAVPDEAALERLDKLVRSRIGSFAIPVSLTLLHEIGAAETI
ncbi:MAG: hypothetical protein M3198_16690 [Actinomycetota bacterium]|nr:hypothetical protein [Actinomycetota bacterium]